MGSASAGEDKREERIRVKRVERMREGGGGGAMVVIMAGERSMLWRMS